MKLTNCKACGKEIWFLKTRNGKYIPVNGESLSLTEKNDLVNDLQRLFDPEKHVSHFADCPAAKQFRNKEYKNVNR